MSHEDERVRAPEKNKQSLLQVLGAWAKRLKSDAVMLWFACRHERTPLAAKALGAFVVAYALSPIDLIPDFIPILGYVDDALLLPALIWVAIRMLPPDVVEECRVQATAWMSRDNGKPRSPWGAVLIVSQSRFGSGCGNAQKATKADTSTSAPRPSAGHAGIIYPRR